MQNGPTNIDTEIDTEIKNLRFKINALNVLNTLLIIGILTGVIIFMLAFLPFLLGTSPILPVTVALIGPPTLAICGIGQQINNDHLQNYRRSLKTYERLKSNMEVIPTTTGSQTPASVPTPTSNQTPASELEVDANKQETLQTPRASQLNDASLSKKP